ncbi:MAG: DNA primase [Acidobacteria bacterium]|nr:DNA primase [Acidobacteriota bacterium]MCW5949257.1 DNA primase [Pyrinomonadaceae bacterium]
MYSQDFLNDLKQRADIVGIIKRHVPDLKKRGANWTACCPFHQEKTPSFSVNAEKGFYKCFGCSKAGSAIDFIMETEGLTFPEAVERIADVSGVSLPEPINDEAFKRARQRRDEQKQAADRVMDLNRLAMNFWERALAEDTQAAKRARDYLDSRGITAEMRSKFRIGYAPASWDAILNELKASGADDELIGLSGLVKINEEKKTYDRFRDRLIFPIFDVNGRPVAFGGRSLDPDATPKYLNSPETPAYVKGEHLYGLYQNKSAIQTRKFLILVEGYLDLISLVQHGIGNVVASLGTALAEEQARLIRRFSEKVVINYDGDTAGIKAARRAVELLLPNRLDIKVLTLPNGMDPDDFVRGNGPKEYEKQRGAADPYVDFVVRSVQTGRDMSNPHQKSEAVNDALAIVRLIPDAVERREVFKKILKGLDVDSSLEHELWSSIQNEKRASRPPGQIARPTAPARLQVTPAEKELLGLLIFDKEVREEVMQTIQPFDYESIRTRPIFDAFVGLFESGNGVNEESIANALVDSLNGDESCLDFVNSLYSESASYASRSPEDSLGAAASCLASLKLIAIDNRILEIRREAEQAESAQQNELAAELSEEQMQLEKQRLELSTSARTL